MIHGVQQKVLVQKERARVRRVLDSIPGIVSACELEDDKLAQSANAALLRIFKMAHQPFSTLDDSAPPRAQITWLRDSLESTLDPQDLVLSVSGLTFWQITVSDGSDWLSGLWMEWKEVFLLSPKRRVLLAFLEEEHRYEAHRETLQESVP